MFYVTFGVGSMNTKKMSMLKSVLINRDSDWWVAADVWLTSINTKLEQTTENDIHVRSYQVVHYYITLLAPIKTTINFPKTIFLMQILFCNV